MGPGERRHHAGPRRTELVQPDARGAPLREVFPDADALARRAAEEFVRACRQACEARGRFVVALSGGSTPKRLHALLTASPYRERIEWGRIHFLFGDDRYVPPTHEESNERMARETLLSKAPVTEGQVHCMYAPGGPDRAAALYEEVVRSVLGTDLAIDLTFLGLGPDGHTLSLFPGRGSVYEKGRLVIAAKANVGVEDRITMTAPLVNRSRQIVFLVAGADKADAVHRAIEGPENWDETPSQAVARHGAHVLWLLDRGASSRIG